MISSTHKKEIIGWTQTQRLILTHNQQKKIKLSGKIK